ncbi:hypothetical protein AOQ84DRAFT_16912 [Glonium stellatum]|uniref:Uncharacterized protein n=1 Tax=Glonium stellatum TaxID=574774 RepID=A0A8E2F2W5_9PEZI|nr:hypothetical protein AOQ84DRAFT_16912 [Glonium stellatum]
MFALAEMMEAIGEDGCQMIGSYLCEEIAAFSLFGLFFWLCQSLLMFSSGNGASYVTRCLSLKYLPTGLFAALRWALCTQPMINSSMSNYPRICPKEKL